MASNNLNVIPKVLVLLASYNGAIWIGEQIDSILAQKGVSVHIRVRDDCSKDDTVAIVVKRFGNDDRVSLDAAITSSGSAGANFRTLFRGVPDSGYDFVALADQDDIWHPLKMISAVEMLKQSGAQGYSCAVRSFWPDGRELKLQQNSSIRGADFLFEGAGQGCTFVIAFPFFLEVRNFCLKHPLFVERFHYHDWLIYLLARAWQFDWVFDDREWMRYRQHAGNEIGSRGSFNAVWRRIVLIRNGWYKREIDKAVDVLQLITLRSSVIANFSEEFRRPDSIHRRFFLFVFFLVHGRRRRVDRCVMSVAALVGWI